MGWGSDVAPMDEGEGWRDRFWEGRKALSGMEWQGWGAEETDRGWLGVWKRSVRRSGRQQGLEGVGALEGEVTGR